MSSKLPRKSPFICKMKTFLPYGKRLENLKNMISGSKTLKKTRVKNKRKFSIKIIVSAYQMPTAGAHKPTFPPFGVQRKPYTNERAKRAS